MPRSSGGGSHSGGYHSSSSSSHSRSSGGGSHSSGYHSSSSSRSSSSYSSHSYGGGYSSHSSFGHRPPPPPRPSHVHHTYYTSPTYHAPRRPRRERETHLWRLIFWLPLLLLVFVAGLETFFDMSSPTISTNYNTRIVIEDNTGVLKDTTALNASLTAFLDKTGISPAVITVYNDDWEPHYSNLEAKAYDLYVNHFDDESHWLIVYSGPRHANPAFTEWHWEGMQGDDTVSVLTQDVCDQFGERLQKYLTAERYTVDQAICRAFDEIVLPENTSDWFASLIAFLFLVGLTLWGLCRRTGILLLFNKSSSSTIPVNAMKDILPKPQPTIKTAEAAVTEPVTFQTAPVVKSDECACPYCGSIYKLDLMACPQCGASRKA